MSTATAVNTAAADTATETTDRRAGTARAPDRRATRQENKEVF